MSKALDLTGQKFGRLTAIKPTEKRYFGSVVWQCLCDCGNTCGISSNRLRTGNTQSCRCLQKEQVRQRQTTHGNANHPLYTLFGHMTQRCNNPKDISYHLYGGRGIKICSEWQNNPKAFIEWALSHGWKRDLTIDRWPNNNGPYSPNNCRFATSLQQANNTRHLKLFIAYGPCSQIEIAKNQHALARKWGLSQTAIGQCLLGNHNQHKGWTFEHLTPRGNT